MNILGLIFSILMILSYGYYAFSDKHTAASRLTNIYKANQQAHRQIFNEYESVVYNKSCKRARPDAKSSPSKPTTKKPEKPTSEEEGEPPEETSFFNQDCAKLNLWPLIQEGKEPHLPLYELAARLIRTFYPSLSTGEKRFEYRFLDVLISSAKETLQQEGALAFEKVSLTQPAWQKIYYKMLKGTKHWDLKEQIGYPPLLDYIKADPSQDKICAFHANLDLMIALFDQKVGVKLYNEIHKKVDPSPLTKELIERISFEAKHISIDTDLLQLLQLGRHYPKDQKKAFVAEDVKNSLYLRKNLLIEG